VLQFTLPGTPVLRYGEEIGMGEDLSLPQRDAIRTPMQWSDATQGGFSSAEKLVRPVIADGEYGYQTVNVTAQRADPNSLLSWFERMLRTLAECPEFGAGECTVLDVQNDAVVALRFDGPTGSVLALTNLRDEPFKVQVPPQRGVAHVPFDVFGNRQYPEPAPDLSTVELAGYGYRWIRLARAVGVY